MAPPPRTPVALVRAQTRDGVWLDGFTVQPPRGPRDLALIWVHGLGSAFSSGQPLIRALSRRLAAAGIGYFKFDNRGHDVVARHGRHLVGAAFERFADSAEDIRAMLAFARACGYARAVLAGHSTGANKVLHYAGLHRDRRVAGVALVGPVSDVAGEVLRVGAAELARRVSAAARLAARDPRALVPRAWGFYGARRYLSLYRAGAVEDVFPYYRRGARWAALGGVRVPVAVFVGGRDEFLDRPAGVVVGTIAGNATRAPSFTGRVIEGAAHGFQGHETALASAIATWIARHVPAARGGGAALPRSRRRRGGRGRSATLTSRRPR